MSADQEIKQRISAYLDRELSAEERADVERLIAEDPRWKRYFRELSQVSLSLRSWPDAIPSPDLERRLKTLPQREGWTMKTLTGPLGRKVLGGVLVGVLALVVGTRVFETKVSRPVAPPTAAVKGSPAVIPVPVPAPVAPKPVAAPAGAPAMVKADSLSDSYRSVSPASASMEFASMQPSAIAAGSKYEGRSYDVKEGLYYPQMQAEPWNREGYNRIEERGFLEALGNPLSTFSVDVDTASYSNVRRFLTAGQLPPKDAVRIEEMINYFGYDYPQPAGGEPFSVTTEVGACPWNQESRLLLIGLQGKRLTGEKLPPSNLVFLIDVSGSMNQPDKLPLLKEGLLAMVDRLGPDERVAIVTYAGEAGLVLDSTPGSQKETIKNAIRGLTPGGSTAGAAGIQLAYEIAQKGFIKGGNNRVVLATDGDFNVGTSSDGELTRLIEEKRQGGVFLTVLGFGTGNYQDAKMEQIADKGNGNLFYIDSLREAQKVLVQELGSTLFTIAKDVKIQVEFNPRFVKSYRLVGYENRMLAKEDFKDDKKDAGEVGAGHSVTALYEIVLADGKEPARGADDLKYQKTEVAPSGELLTVKLRYKDPDGEVSKLIEKALAPSGVPGTGSDNLRFAGAVAEFGLLLRDSEYKGKASFGRVLEAARQSKGQDPWGYRQELIELVEKARALAGSSGSGGIEFKGDPETR